MRDLFEEFFANNPLDPTEAARLAVRPRLMQRFYSRVGTVSDAGGVSIRLDDRPIKTPARRPLVAPSEPLAQAIAAEWEAQTDVIDPAKMPLTRLANSIIDGVADNAAAVAAEVAKYLGSDLLCYRAETPRGLIVRQAEMWDPILAFARDQLGARFVLTEGVTFIEQPEHAIAAARRAIPEDPWRLGAVHAITTLTGSALIGLALAAGALTVDAAWAAAHVDEDWNMAQWGRDAIALERRAVRFAEMRAAATVLELLKVPP